MANPNSEHVRRSQVERREKSDKRMISAAIQLIARQGVGNTSLAEVGLAAGYSRGLPVDRYGSKIGLVAAVLQSMDIWFDRLLSDALQSKRGLEAVRQRIKTHLDGARRSPEGLTALFSIYIESLFSLPELKPDIKRITSGWRRGLIKNLREGQEMGEIRSEIDCKQQADMILGMLRGLQIDYLLGDRSAGLDAAEAALAIVVRDMILARPIDQSASRKKSVLTK
jgi:AcrR family transcriptional regulator